MVKPTLRGLVAALILSVLSVGTGASAHAETLRIGGTGSALGTMRILGDAFMRSRQAATIEVLPSLGSGGGIKALAANALDLAVSTRDLKDEERAKGLHAQVYGKTALVFATPSSNPIDGVTSAELVAIFSGETAVWPNGEPARPILRPKAETDTQLAEEHIVGMREALERARDRQAVPTFFTDQETADALERMPGSVGTMSLSLIISERRELKALALDGQMATPQSIANGTYPITKTFYFVLPAAPSQMIKDFVAFVFSPEGQAILEYSGHQTLPAVSG